MNRSLFAYLCWTFFLYFFFIHSFLVFFLISFQLIKIFNLFISQEFQLYTFFKLVICFILNSLNVTVPVSCFVSSLAFYSKISSESEYVAMRSLGYSLRGVLTPVLLLSTLLSFFFYTLGRDAIPSSRAESRKIISELKSKALLYQLRQGVFFTAIKDVTFFTLDFNKETLEMNSVFLHHKNTDVENQGEKLVWAQRGQLVFNDKSAANRNEANHLRLLDGFMTILDKNGKELEQIKFRRFDYNLPGLDSYFDSSKKPGLLDTMKLNELAKRAPSLLEKKNISLEIFMDIFLERVERYFIPFSSILLTILGFLMGLRHSRTSVRSGNVKSFVLIFSYFICYYALLGVAKKGKILYWLPSAVTTLFLLIILVMAWRKARWVVAS